METIMAAEKREYVDWLNTKVLQKIVIFDEEDNMLGLRRVETGPAARPGKWDLSGGSISPEDLATGSQPHKVAAAGEVKAETGLEITDLKVVFVSSWTFEKSPGKILGLALGYKARAKGIRPQVNLSDEHVEYNWFSREQLLSLDFGEDGGLHKSIIESA